MPHNELDFEPPFYEKGINTAEYQENAQLTISLEMLQRIIEDLNPQDFTLKEIQDEFNARGKFDSDDKDDFKATRVRFGPSHIETLLEDGLIEENEPEGQSGEQGSGEKHYHLTESGQSWYDRQPAEGEDQEQTDGE